MAKFTFSLLPLALYLLFNVAMVVSASFIDDSCKDTLYPTECVKSLSPYSVTIQNSPQKMAQAALIVGLTQSQSGKALVAKFIKSKESKGDEYKTLDVCFDQLDSSVDIFSQSVEEMKLIAKNDNKKFRISNVQTWVSAALTDQDTCLEALADKGLNGKNIGEIISSVTNTKKVTSNSLALVNKFSRGNTI